MQGFIAMKTILEKWLAFREMIEPELAKVRKPEFMRDINYERPMGRRKKRAFDKAHPSNVKHGRRN